MKLWWMAVLSIVIGNTALQAAAMSGAGETAVKGEEGQTFAVVVVCNDCQSASGKGKKRCGSGGEQGWLNGQPCGKCLVQSNYGTMLRHPYDIHITGTLVDAAGQPVKNRFVKLFLPNDWTVKSKTSDQGMFRLRLGATVERKSNQPLVTDLGKLVDPRTGDDQQFAIYLMPPSYKPCGPASAPASKPKGKKP